MIITKLELKNYRNIIAMVLEPDPHINVIYGENAQGKTNLLESIYYLSAGKAFRGSKDSDLVRFESKREEKTEITAMFSTTYDSFCGKVILKESRSGQINGIPIKTLSELGDQFPAVIFSPKDLNLIKDGPEERRRFLDNGLYQIKSSYGGLLKNYKTALEQRNALLKNIRANMDWRINLEVWDQAVARIGAKIIYQRDCYLARILNYAVLFFDGLGGETEKLEMRMIKTVVTQDCVTEAIEQKMMEELLKSQEKDIECGFTTVGPHRDDIEFLINGNAVKNYGSQGQQRSTVLALKMGEAYVLNEVYEENPIVLLDDVMSELDLRRQNYILNHINQFQVFITCCDKETILRLKEGKTFLIEQGTISMEDGRKE